MTVHALDGARERLRRADENIQQLNQEIAGFLASVPIVNLGVEGNEPVISFS
jgi:hypothetical protein